MFIWTVRLSSKAHKALSDLPEAVRSALWLLVADLRSKGPVARNWPNYSKLGKNEHHCHLKKGRPTYVSLWREVKTGNKTIEVTYVGNHEKAPY
jgi:mRNA-degrading endonuclease RelE of RelBE toxin-antitoxin system